MAPADEDRPARGTQDDTANPFIAFRRFADEQMSNLMNAFYGQSTSSSSSSSSSRHSFDEYKAWLEEVRAAQPNIDREAEEAGRIMDVYTKAYRDSAQEKFQRAFGETGEPLRCPYRPNEQEASERPNMDADHPLRSLGAHLHPTVFAAPFLGNPVMPSSMGYLLFSPYSPFHLEHHQALRNRGIAWREAFEDLMAVQDGDNATSRNMQYEPLGSSHWVRRAAGIPEDSDSCRPFQYRRENGANEQGGTRHRDECAGENEDQEPVTELDLYRFFLGADGLSSRDEDTSPSDPPSQSLPQLNSTSADKIKTKPSILSTLTTTERTTLSDGTINTKVVLKKRFSDGREESSETMHTQNPTPKVEYQPPTKAIQDQGSSQTSAERDNQNAKRKGWFWS